MPYPYIPAKVVGKVREELLNKIQSVRCTDGFENVEDYVKAFTIKFPSLGEGRWEQGGDTTLPAGKEAFRRDCSPDTPIPGKELIFTRSFESESAGLPQLGYGYNWMIPGLPDSSLNANKVVVTTGVMTHGTPLEEIQANTKIAKEEVERKVDIWWSECMSAFKSWNKGLSDTVKEMIAAQKEVLRKENEIGDAINAGLEN